MEWADTKQKKEGDHCSGERTIHLTGSHPLFSLPLAISHFFPCWHINSWWDQQFWVIHHGQKYPARLSHFIISLLLSQALCRSASLLFSGLCNANPTSKTQFIGPYLHPQAIHARPSISTFASPPVHLQCFLLGKFCCLSLMSVNIGDSFLTHLPCACSSFPKTSHVHQPTHPSLSVTQISSLSSFQTWLSNAAGQPSNFSLITSHLLPPQPHFSRAAVHIFSLQTLLF